jgi:hypothetical protein
MAYDGPMFRLATLLRALLCLTLLVNGTAYVHAATRMAMGDVASDGTGTPHGAPPCHEDMATHASTGDVATDAGSDDHAAGLPDCCKAGACDGFCTQHAPVLAWQPMLPPLPQLQADAPAYRADVHVSARLSHRHRPPILAA